MKFSSISIDRLRELLSYDPTNGEFRWRKNLKGTARLGALAGGKNHADYRRVRLDGVDLLLHRCAWAFHHNEWPTHILDHINGDRSDNRICNLRLSNNVQNMQNRRLSTSHNATHLLGAHKTRNPAKFRAKITVDGRQIVLGVFDTAIEAHQVYVEAKRVMHPGCTI